MGSQRPITGQQGAPRQTGLGAVRIWSGYLRLRSERLALCPDGTLWVDVEAFEETSQVFIRWVHHLSSCSVAQTYLTATPQWPHPFIHERNRRLRYPKLTSGRTSM